MVQVVVQLEIVEQRILIWIVSAAAAYLFYRWLFGARDRVQSVSRYETEIEEILTSDKYKVKGRFED